jgi:hypothetical protein
LCGAARATSVSQTRSGRQGRPQADAEPLFRKARFDLDERLLWRYM